ncbi:cupin domain-containing protein [Sandarakinorhabdus oryzae]|uniref:cupin domain-containing protein n=1 Tax=Sandarakinorhabdus oryzae TaxID=2675220 RepID=UPI0012E2E75C|nr:cupin domain-containing protein [Sandarakinorhabdus oryzae]
MGFARTATTAPIRVLADELRLLLRSANSPAAMSVMVVDVPPGGGVPPHSHAAEEEGYYLLSGTLDLMVGNETHRLGPGDFGHVPPGTLHGYANPGREPVRFLAWTVGGPVDDFFEAMSREVQEMPRDAAAMAALTQRFGITMAGPPG